MSDLVSTERVFVDQKTSATAGKIVWLPLKSLWLIAHTTLGLVGILSFARLDALVIFLILTSITICAGHSVGMHRLLIHRSFETRRSLEYFLVWFGTLVGMAGPIGMIKAHDLRDWHQRQATCPDHPAHRASFFRDAWWQLCCEFRLENPPELRIEQRVGCDWMYRWMEKTWMLQQVPLALLLFWMGGWAWVLWGCSLRISVSLIGHWMIGHFAHNCGQQGWVVEGLQVQGYNLPGLGLLTFGENWHGNHHAFPHSAKLGVEQGQLDPGFLLIVFLEKIGLVWNVKTVSSEPERDGLMRV